MYGLCSISDFCLCDFVHLSLWQNNDISEIECFVFGQSKSITLGLNRALAWRSIIRGGHLACPPYWLDG